MLPGSPRLLPGRPVAPRHGTAIQPVGPTPG
jgi:hypothetical protein